MMAETVTPDTSNPPCHELFTTVWNELELLLWEYESHLQRMKLQLEPPLLPA